MDRQAYNTANMPPSDSTRSWSLRKADFMADVILTCEKYATCCFINKYGRTVCHIHATTKLKAHDNDFDDDAKFSVTGVPFAPSQPEVERTIAYLEPKVPKKAALGKRRRQRDPLAPNHRFTLERVLKFFPQDPSGTFYIMHCGCVLEHALFDFVKFKSLVIESDSSHIQERYDRMAKPRERLADFTFVSRFGISVFDLFQYDIDGNEITEIDRWQAIVNRLSAKIREKSREEYRSAQLEIMRKAEEAKEKLKARGLGYIEVDSDDAGSSIFYDDREEGPSRRTTGPRAQHLTGSTSHAHIRRRPILLESSDDSETEEEEALGEVESEDEDEDGDRDAEGSIDEGSGHDDDDEDDA